MATHKSAVKRARQNEIRRLRNKTFRTKSKTAVTRLRSAITGGSAEQAQEKLVEAVATLQKSVSRGVLHRKTASRKISRLSKQVNRLSKTSA